MAGWGAGPQGHGQLVQHSGCGWVHNVTGALVLAPGRLSLSGFVPVSPEEQPSCPCSEVKVSLNEVEECKFLSQGRSGSRWRVPVGLWFSARATT